jgi:hypothetical protein
MNQVETKLSEPEVAIKFGSNFAKQYLAPAFGSRSKSEIDLLVFGCLIEAGAVDPAAPIYETARALNITPARTRALLLNWQLRSTSSAADLRTELISVLQKTRFTKDGTLMSFGVESPLLREEIRARLKRRGIFADASFSQELLRLPVEAFVEFLDDIVDETTKKKLQKILVRQKQLPDHGFKAIAIGILAKLGEKAAGKAGEELAGGLVKGAGEALKPAIDRVASFLTSLLKEDAEGAAASLAADDVVSTQVERLALQLT